MLSSTNELQPHPSVLVLAREPNRQALITFMPSAHAQTQIAWVDTDDEHLLVNTEEYRQRYRNVERNRSITVVIQDE